MPRFSPEQLLMVAVLALIIIGLAIYRMLFLF
jgi:hypothetical protein